MDHRMSFGAVRVSFFLIIASSLTVTCKRTEQPRFGTVDPVYSGIHFNNQITESDSVNLLRNENVYNGGGTGIGDFDNNGLPDIFLAGNMVESRLYLNDGDFRFRDITLSSGIDTKGRWCRGVAVTDINNDGLPDIYVSATQKARRADRRNLLFINQGCGSDKVPHFVEDAAGYGLADDSHTTQAYFFDYDNDGDNDVYLVINEINDAISPYHFRYVMKNGKNPSTGKLLRNDYDSLLKHPLFTDVSREAGIQKEGYGHSAIITDINMDGWKDIVVGNDFITNDLLWINNGDGTFTDEMKLYFKHTSANTMGSAAADINNDGLTDYIFLDMNPEDNFRKKMMLPANAYQLYQNTERYRYTYQYVRNTLQLNQGFYKGEDSVSRPLFSEIGFYAGIYATDWSWTPMLNDFDNDGDCDLIVSNGFPKDITDHDFAMYRQNAYYTSSSSQLLSQIPVVKLHNYAFRNNSDMTFTDVSAEWGMTAETFSNGSAYADFDNDGDVDIVMNNINDEALLLRNYTMEKSNGQSSFIRFRLKGSGHNTDALGARLELYYDNGKMQVCDNYPFRGYLSSVEPVVHFGLGSATMTDSLVVKWPDGRKSIMKNLPAGKLYVADNNDAVFPEGQRTVKHEALFSDITVATGISYVDEETDFVDFNIQKLLPHKYSEEGPALAVGDIDGNGTDDLVCGGSSFNLSRIFLQQSNGKFIQKEVPYSGNLEEKNHDDAGILLFDADGDGDPDLYIASGGYENDANSPAYSDHLYINNGKGDFSEVKGVFPANNTSKSCVRAADFDRDGDLDLFIAGRVDPWHYPRPVSCSLLRNDSEGNKIKFTDITHEVAGDLINMGMISDAAFTDFNNDGWPDLVLAGEWLPPTFLRNDSGIYRNITSSMGLSAFKGWWSSVVPGDFDNDGDIDYVFGNLGLNTWYHATPSRPLSVYASDYDKNGSYDAFPAIYLSSSQKDTSFRKFPLFGRDDAVKQMISLRAKFQNYQSFANATIDNLFSEDQLKTSLVLEAGWLKSSFCRNDGNRFTLVPLPAQAQLSVLKGMVADDFDQDGNLDLIVNGNDWGTEVFTGRYDALNGLMLLGAGNGSFNPSTVATSGIYLPGNGRALVKMKGADGSYLIAASQNRGQLKIFRLNQQVRLIPFFEGDQSSVMELKNGKARKNELFSGSSYLSQSGRFILAGKSTSRTLVSNSSGRMRVIDQQTAK